MDLLSVNAWLYCPEIRRTIDRSIGSHGITIFRDGCRAASKARNVSSLVLKLLDEINEVWMFDCGEGTQRQI